MKIKNLVFFFFFTVTVYPQQQVHIPWPSLANSPWPNTRGDAQATGRSKYIGPRTPNVIWRKDMPLGIANGPIIGYNDNLFIGTNSLNSNGFNYFFSLDKNGDSIWTYLTEGNRANVAGGTITNDGTIYFSSLGIDFASGGGLYALSPDGSLKWKNEKFVYTYFTRLIAIGKNNNLYLSWIDSTFVLEPLEGHIIDTLLTPFITANDIVFSTNGDTIFYLSGRLFTTDPRAINAMTISGEHLWSLKFDHLNRGTPLIDNSNKIYIYGYKFPGEISIYSINPDGSINWKYLLDSISSEGFSNYSSPTIDRNGNIIFETSTQDSGYITSVDYFGNLNWKTTLGHYYEDGAFINHGLVCDDEGKIYCGSSVGETTNFWCLDSNGDILWKLELEGYEYDTSPAINSEGTLYIGTHLSSLFQNHERNLIAINDSALDVNEEYNFKDFHLYQNYPNPFNPITHIDFMIKERGNVFLKVYNILGEEIETLVNEEKIPGYYSIMFNGSEIPSGVYFYELITEKIKVIKKMILIK